MTLRSKVLNYFCKKYALFERKQKKCALRIKMLALKMHFFCYVAFALRIAFRWAVPSACVVWKKAYSSSKYVTII